MANVHDLKTRVAEHAWWERVRARGALWYLVNKGLLFLILYPLLGCYVMNWVWEPMLMVEGWVIGLVCGGSIWMRQEIRSRFSLDCAGQIASCVGDK